MCLDMFCVPNPFIFASLRGYVTVYLQKNATPLPTFVCIALGGASNHNHTREPNKNIHTMTYRALTCHEISPDAYTGIDKMKVMNLPRQPLGPKDARVSVGSSSLNFPELLMLQNKYQFKPQLPFVMCTEAAGVVLEVGASVTNVKVGQRVMFMSMAPGTCSEEWAGKADALTPLPDNLSFSQGAAFLMGYLTGYHALAHRGKLKKGEWLLVTGAGGGMGIAAVQLGKALGAKVIAAASSDAKLEVCKRAGADFTVNYSKENLKKAVGKITKNKFCDVIYEPVGGDIFDQSVRCVAQTGYARLLVVGFASGRIPTLPVNMALIKGFDLVGVRMGAQLAMQPHLKDEMVKDLVALASKGLLTPIVDKEYSLDNAKEAFKLMADRKVQAKVCITFPVKAKL